MGLWNPVILSRKMSYLQKSNIYLCGKLKENSIIIYTFEIMLPHHQEVFYTAAETYTCWIALREPNPLAERWIGRNGFRPKGHDCEAKTADNPAHRWAGLVVSPVLLPEAFRQDGGVNSSLYLALEKWRTFLSLGRLPAGFTCADSGLEKGVVRQNGLAIFADYDLMTLVKSDKKGSFLTTTDADELALMDKVIPHLNNSFGTKLFELKMIQHGPEFDPNFYGLGARAREQILYFGPGHRFQIGTSSMRNEGPKRPTVH